MDNKPEGGWVVTSKTVTTTISVLSLVGILWMAVTFVNSHTFRLEKLERDNVGFTSAIDKLSSKIDDLNVKIVELTISLNRLQDRAGDFGSHNL